LETFGTGIPGKVERKIIITVLVYKTETCNINYTKEESNTRKMDIST